MPVMSVEVPETEAAHWRPAWAQRGPRKRWLLLAIWVGLILAIVATQWLTRFSFEHGYWEGGGLTEPTTVELLWYWLPLFLIVVLAVVFLVGLRWWVPERATRGMIRVWGIVPTFAGLLASCCISLWYSTIYFYMD